MITWFIRIIVCLLAGTITTVAVAWGIAYVQFDEAWQGGRQSVSIDRITDNNGEQHDIEFVRAFFEVTEPYSELEIFARKAGWPNAPTILKREAVGIEVREFVYQSLYCIPVVGKEDQIDFNRYAYTLQSGWPCRALSGDAIPIEPGYRDGIPIDSDLTTPYLGRADAKILPTRPMKLGFTINVVFYACIWFTLFFGVWDFRRMIRRWQGYCPHCKYDLQGHTLPMPHHSESGGTNHGCPECGWNRETN